MYIDVSLVEVDINLGMRFFLYGIHIMDILLVESFYNWTTLNLKITPALVSQLEVNYMVDRLLTSLTAQQIETTA